MDAYALIDAIEQICERIDVEVRRAPLGGEGGGLCAIKGQKVLYLDTSADPLTQCEKCLADLASLPEIDNLHVAPFLREALDRARKE